MLEFVLKYFKQRGKILSLFYRDSSCVWGSSRFQATMPAHVQLIKAWMDSPFPRSFSAYVKHVPLTFWVPRCNEFAQRWKQLPSILCSVKKGQSSLYFRNFCFHSSLIILRKNITFWFSQCCLIITARAMVSLTYHKLIESRTSYFYFFLFGEVPYTTFITY